jgi:uncharacterized membrane protein YdjX (TVP38/TMEM64 family)
VTARLRALLTPQRLALGALLLVAAATLLWVLRASGAALSPAAIRALLAQLGPWGPLALIASLAAVLVVPVVPATVLQVGAGLAFGPWLGLAYALAADALGATAGFWLARRWGRALIERWLSEQQRAVLARLARRVTWRSMLLLRLLPGPAYPLVSFAAGYSAIGFGAYITSSLLGVLPALALLALAGDLVTSSPLLAFAIVGLFVGALALAGRMLAGPEPAQETGDTDQGSEVRGQ